MSSEHPTQVFPKALEEIRGRLAELEGKVAQRGYDTRPIFEAHEKQLNELRERISELEKRPAEPEVGDLIYKRWAYFTEDGDDHFCRHCYETSNGKKRYHMTGPNSSGDFYCTVCAKFSHKPTSDRW